MGDDDYQRNRLKAVFENLKRLHRENRDTFPRNILLVGMPAAGKSSLANLFHAAFYGQYSEIAHPGSPGIGDDDSVTEHLMHYPQMGLSNEQLKDFRERYEFDDDFIPPSIIDMPGIRRIENDNEEERERKLSIHRRNIDYVLKYVIDGIVPSETPISAVLSGEQNLSNMKRDESLKVDRVIFVISIQQDIDEQMLRNVTKIISGNNGRQKVIPYTVIFTHVDSIGGMDDNDKVPPETAERRKKIAADILKIGKNMKLNSHDLSNYNDVNDETDDIRTECYRTNWEKHVNVIQAFCKLCTRKKIIADQPIVGNMELAYKNIGQMLRRVWDNKFTKILTILIFLAMMVALVTLYVKVFGSPLQNIQRCMLYVWDVIDAILKTLIL